MQYIQLQGQVAADLDLPLQQGSYNLFIDTSDNSIKAKDSDGHMHGGGGLSLTEINREEIDHLILSASLTPGAFYKITAAASRSYMDNRSSQYEYNGYGNEIQEGGTTVIVQATTDKTLSEGGIGLFYVPSYVSHSVWDTTFRLAYSNINGIFDHNELVTLYSSNTETSTAAYLVGNVGNNTLTIRLSDANSSYFRNNAVFTGLTITGQWTSATADIIDYDYITAYQEGDKVIYGGKVWENLNGNNGYKVNNWALQERQLNPEDWRVVSYNDVDYTLVANTIKYDYKNDSISYRTDGINEISNDFDTWYYWYGYNIIGNFPWGHPNVKHTSFKNTYLNTFVNVHNSSTFTNIKFDNQSTFDANYWGRNSQFENIECGIGSSLTNLSLSYRARISDIKIANDAYLGDIFTYDNDYNDIQLRYITLENNSYISSDYDPLYLYKNSSIQRIHLDVNAYISDINLHDYANLGDINLGVSAGIYSISLGLYSDIRYITIAPNSSLHSINMGVESEISSVDIASNSSIDYVGMNNGCGIYSVSLAPSSQIFCSFFDNNSYFENINLASNASMYLLSLTTGSYASNINLGNNSSINNINGTSTDYQIYDIALGGHSNINNITLGHYSKLYDIDMRQNANINYIALEDDAYIRRSQIGVDSGIYSCTLQTGSSIVDFQLGNDAGFGGLTVSASIQLSNFDIQQNSGFGGYTVTSSMDAVTLSRGFNNFNNTQLQDPSGSNGNTNGRPNVNFDNRNIVKFDISGISTYQGYALPDGQYEGQEITFIVDSDGSHTITPIDIELWSTNIKMTGYNYNLGSNNGAIKPFARLNINDAGATTIWKNMSKVVWTGGKWYSDAELYND